MNKDEQTKRKQLDTIYRDYLAKIKKIKEEQAVLVKNFFLQKEQKSLEDIRKNIKEKYAKK